MTRFIALLALTLAVTACKEKPQQNDTTQTVDQPLVAAPAFDADSAYRYIDRQLAFGPRVPNTSAHVNTGDYIVAKFKEFGCQVTEQTFVATAWNGKKYNARNIIASINPDSTKRVFLSSHWDSRPIADSDSLEANRIKPVPSANDGASGVGVMLELARTIQQAKTKPHYRYRLRLLRCGRPRRWRKSRERLRTRKYASRLRWLRIRVALLG